jgi:ankyrin repeat protein
MDNNLTTTITKKFLTLFRYSSLFILAGLFASTNVHADCVEKYANLDQSNPYDLTRLMIASKKNDVYCVKEFIEKGDDPNQSTPEGLRALDLAEKHGHPEIVDILQKITDHRIDESQRTLLSKIQKHTNEDDMPTGLCFGLSTIWAVSKWLQLQPKTSAEPRDDYDWFKATIRLINGWDEKRELSFEESTEFERFYELVKYFQLDQEQFKLENKQWDLIRGLNELNKTTIKKEYSIAGSFTLEQLKQLLDTKSVIQDNKLIIIVTTSHAVALFKNKADYFFYDPNNLAGEFQTSSIDKITKMIFHEGFYTQNKNMPTTSEDYNTPASFGFLMLSPDEKPPEYPSQKTVLDEIYSTINPNEQYWMGGGLSLAAQIGCIESLQYFLEKGADPDQFDHKGWTALMYAAQKGHIDCINMLLKKGADPNQLDHKGLTALMAAANYGHIDCVKALLENGADPNQFDHKGFTALIFAAQNEHIDCVDALLKKEADPNQSNSVGQTPLMAAADYGHIDCVKALLKNGADPNQFDHEGETALIHASEEGRTNCVDALLEKGADPNQSNFDGRTPLMAAAKQGHIGCVNVLIKKGAHLNQRDSSGNTAITLAEQNGRLEIVEILQKLLDNEHGEL